jgi:Tfp pilus assembly protein PilW
MVTVGLFSIASAALGTMLVYSTKSFASMANYAILDLENREAMDILSREIRQARHVQSYSSNQLGNSLTILDANNSPITYSFNAYQKQLVRTAGGASDVVLTNCNLLNFALFQRNPSNGNYGVFPVASGNWTQSVKVVQLTWRTSRRIPSGPVNSENIQTARIVIRKQQDN